MKRVVVDPAICEEPELFEWIEALTNFGVRLASLETKVEERTDALSRRLDVLDRKLDSLERRMDEVQKLQSRQGWTLVVAALVNITLTALLK